MQMRIAMFGLVLLILGCSSVSRSAAWPSHWMDASAGRVNPGNADELSADRIDILDSEDEEKARLWLSSSGRRVSRLSEMPGFSELNYVRNNARTPAGDLYLVRAVSDGGGGVFSVYVNENGVMVLYSVMGNCVPSEMRVLLMRLDAVPKGVYGGCGGTM